MGTSGFVRQAGCISFLSVKQVFAAAAAALQPASYSSTE